MATLNTQDQADLLFGDSQSLATYLGVTAKTIDGRKDGQTMQTAAFKLMQLRYGAALGGSDWEGFTLGKDGKMYLPSWRGGFEPHAIRAMFFQVQLVRSLKAQISALERREAELEADSDALKKAVYYRHLARLESSMGMMLEKITEI